jgi:glutamyl-tRNA reductase
MKVVLLSFHVADVGVEALGGLALSDRAAVEQKLREQMVLFQAKEAFYLATCNRVEFAFVFGAQVPDDFTSLSPSQPRLYWGLPAVTKHLLSVALAQDSVVIGESQIMGQFKTAVQDCQALGLMGAVLNRLTNLVIREAKRVRTEMGLTHSHSSVSTVAGKFLLQHPDPSDRPVILIGAGETNQLLARYLSKRGHKNFVWVNRTHARAERAAFALGGSVVPWEALGAGGTLQSADFMKLLPKAFAVVLATNAGGVILGAEALAQISPDWVIDLSIPANADREVVEAAGSQYWSLDDMSERLRLEKQVHADLLAELKIEIEAGTDVIVTEMQSSRVSDLLGLAVSETERAFEQAWTVALKELAHLDPAELEQVRQWSRKTVNQMLHQHLELLKRAAVVGSAASTGVSQGESKLENPQGASSKSFAPLPELNLPSAVTVDQIAEVIHLARRPRVLN